MDRRELLGAGLGMLAGTATLVADGQATSLPPHPQSAYTDRNGKTLGIGMFVYVPCLVTSITPSLNPALTAVGVQTLPPIGSAEYDEGLPLIVYTSQVLKP